MKTFRSRAAATIAVLSTAACSFGIGGTTVQGSGTAIEETRSLGEFRSVSFALPGALIIEQREGSSVRIEADDNLIDHIVTEVRDGRLRIRTRDEARLEPRSPLRIVVATPTLTAIETAGSGSVEAANLRTGNLSVSVAGSGSALLPNLTADVLEVSAAGSGGVRTSGRVREQKISLAGSGSVDAEELESERAEASIAGSGSARINVRDRLSASLAGSGTVRYRGDPQVSSSSVGSGRVEKLP